MKGGVRETMCIMGGDQCQNRGVCLEGYTF